MRLLKTLSFIYIISSLILYSCGSDENPNLPTSENVVGYWKLEKIYKINQSIDFKNYPYYFTGSGGVLVNYYFAFSEDGTFDHVEEQDEKVTFYNGSWNLSADTLRTDFWGGMWNNYTIKGFDQSEIRLMINNDREHVLEFKRIEKDDYPEVIMTAQAGSQSFIARTVEASDQFSYLIISGEDINHIFSFEISKELNLVAGQTYPIDGLLIGARFHKSNIPNDFNLVQDGQLTINKISDTYIASNFSLILRNSNNEEILISDGKFSAIIKGK